MQSAESPFGDLIDDARWRDLRAEFLAEATRMTAEAVDLATAASKAPLTEAERRKLRVLAHRIRGSAGFFEFEAVAASAAALEEAVKSGADPDALAALGRQLHARIEAAREARE